MFSFYASLNWPQFQVKLMFVAGLYKNDDNNCVYIKEEGRAKERVIASSKNDRKLPTFGKGIQFPFLILCIFLILWFTSMEITR